MSDIKGLQEKIAEFVKERDWKQFHNPKDLAISLNLEASEVLELFQWKSEPEIAKYLETNRSDVEEELADVLYWVLLMADNMNIDIVSASEKSLQRMRSNTP